MTIEPAQAPQAAATTPQQAQPRETTTAPTVSVVVPVYNAERTIAEVLAALERSEYRDFETVLVHDHSTDNTAAVLRELAGKYDFRLIEFPENRGVSKARNAGAQAAHGEILLYIDADCIVLPDTIGRCIEELQRGESISVGGAYTPDAWDKDFFSNFQSLYINYVETKNEHPDYIATHCMAIPRQVYLDFGGFREDFFVGHAASVEDVELSHRLLAAGYQLSRPRDIAVQHMFGYNLRRSVKNAVKKSRYWTMYSLHNRDVMKDSGAASYELKFTVFIQSLNAILLLAALVTRWWWLLIPAAVLYTLDIIVCRHFLGLIRRERHWWFLIKAMAYFQFVYPFIVAYGSFLGMLSYIWQVKILRRYT